MPRSVDAVGRLSLREWLQQRFERARQRPARRLAADGALLLGLLAVITLDLRGRLGWVLLGAFLAVHLVQLRTSRQGPPLQSPKEK